MVKSLDELISYLLDEIALSGEQGATIAEILTYVETFYGDDAKAATETPENESLNHSVSRPPVDRAFQEKVWKWLTRHPDVYAGRNKEGNRLTLWEAQAVSPPLGIGPGAHHPLLNSEQKRSKGSGCGKSTPPAQVERTLTSAVMGNETLVENLQGGDQTAPAAAPRQAILDDSAPASLHMEDSKALRVYVSEERIWYAVAGHAPDPNRMQRMDFKLLSIIAAHREKGILQPDLTRISGQDKRSTPVRTQRLHDKGYIEKKKVQTRGQVTSLCTLRKFTISRSETGSNSTGLAEDVTRRDISITKSGPQGELIEVKALLRSIFDVLNEYKIITQLDLKRKLGFLGRRWEMRMMSRTVRKLELMGCVRRVKARSQYERHDRQFHRCVKLIREPENDEWQLSWDPVRALPARLRGNDDDNGAIAEIEGDEEDEEDEEEMDANNARGSQELEGNTVAAGLQEIGRTVPLWTPNQNLNNFLFDIVSMSDTRGLSTMDIKAVGVGNFYRRPVEHQLSRLVDAWQISQPLSLRHLAIVRDTAISKTVAHYVHYSYESFEKLVNSGQSSWEAVEIVRKDAKARKNKIEIAPIGTDPELDEYGFARLRSNCFQGRASNATISESVVAAKLDPFYLGRLDPIAVRLKDGTYGISLRSGLDYNHLNLPMPFSSPHRSTTERKQVLSNPSRPIGRPRKYPKIEEANLSGNPQKMKKWKASLAAANRYKAIQTRESRLKLGVAEDEMLDKPILNGDRLNTGVIEEVLSEQVREEEEIQRPSKRKRSATDADLTQGTRKEHQSTAFEVTVSVVIPNKGIRCLEKPLSYIARSEEEVFDHDAITVGTPSNDSALPSHASVAPSAKEVLKGFSELSQKKTKKVIGASAIKSGSRGHSAVLASASTSLTYEEQVQLLGPRTMTGAYIGQRVSRKCGRGHPPKSRLLVVRSSRLEDFKWFSEGPSSTTGAMTEQVSASSSSLQFTAPKLPPSIPSVISSSIITAPVFENWDFWSIANTALTSAGSTDIGCTYTPGAGNKRKRAASIPEPAILKQYNNTTVLHTGTPAEANPEPETKRRERTPMIEDWSLSKGPVQESTSQHGTDSNDVQSEAASEDGDNDAMQLLNDVMHADSLVSSRIHTDAEPQIHLPMSGEYNNGAMSSSKTDHQNRVLSDDNLVALNLATQLPEMAAQIESPEIVPEELPRSGTTTECARNDPMVVELSGGRSPDMDSTAVSQVGDVSVFEESNTIEARKPEQSTLPTLAQPPVSPEQSQETVVVSQVSKHDEEVSPRKDTRQITAASPAVMGFGTTALPGKQVMDTPSSMAEEGVQESGRKRGRSSYPSRSMIAMGGGSVGAQRRKIIMEIIERCGGIYPGEKELWYPFASAWMKTPDAGKPDQRTVKMATKALVDSGKLRQLKFSFRDKKGLMLTRTILTTPNISPTSPAIKDLERKIIEEDPNPYIPPEADVTQEIRRTNQHCLSKLASARTVTLEKDDRVQLQYIPAYVKHAEKSKKAALERRRIKEEALMRRSITEGNFQLGGDPASSSLRAGRLEPLAKGNKPGRVQRLARLQRPVGTRPQMLPPPPPTFASFLPLGQGTGSIYDLELQSDDPIFSIRQAPREMYPKFTNQRTYRVDEEALGLGPNKHILHPSPIRWEQAATSAIDPRLSNSKSGTSSFGIFEARPRQCWSRKSRDYSFNRHIVTLLNPKIVFHPPTGTFSTEYVTPRKSKKEPRLDPAPDRVRIAGLPHRLEDITFDPNRSPEPDYTNAEDPAKNRFDWAVDTVEKWELENMHALFESSKDLLFINHSLNKDHQSIQYDPVEDLFEAQEWEPGMTTKEIHTKHFKRATQSQINLDTRDRANFETVVSKPAKRPSITPKLKTRRLTSLRERDTTGTVGTSDVDSATPDSFTTIEPRKLRGPQTSRYMPSATIHRIMTAVVVVRTITGGLERNIDWVLIARLFEDQFEPSFVQSRWGTILQKNRLHVERLQADFQNIFIEAYENDVVPPIDYDNLQDYDWAWLVNWAQKQLDIPDTRALPSLPGIRQHLDDLYDLRTEKEPEIETMFEFNSGATLLKRTNIATAAPFTLPLQPRRHKSQDTHNERLNIAKSWVRANVITPEEVYNPEEARRKLLSAGEDTIETALRELISDKMLQQENRGRLIPGRNYDISASFLNNLKKNLEVTHFHQAAAYKLSLDRSFAEYGVATYSYHASDGDLVALNNLLAHGRVTLTARDPPRNKFGLTEGYKTRFMDKSRLNFAIDIRPSATYIYGNPLRPLPPPPQQHLAHPHPTLEGRIPAWFDIHGNVVPIMWEMALAGCLASLAVRPGMGAELMARTFKGSLEAWEVERVLEWLVSAGVAERVGDSVNEKGYMLREWWWACLWG